MIFSRLFNWFRRMFAWFGLGGAVLLSVCILVAALTYTGRSGEPYSLLTHFISELGEPGVSRSAALFNAGIFIAGLSFLLFCLGLGLALHNLFGWLGMLAGVVASISCSLVGLFPMNNLQPHIVVALTYFRFGLVAVLLFGLAIMTQNSPEKAVDPRANLAGLLAVASYAAFLLFQPDSSTLDPNWFAGHRDPSLLAVLEWSVFFSTVIWFFAVALGVRRPAANLPGSISPVG